MAEFAEALPISRPAVSRHLRVLKEAGLVGEQPVGTRRIYRLEAEGMVAIQRYLSQVWGEAAPAFAWSPRTPSPGAAMTEPLRFSLDVDCPAEHAFGVWTDRINLWWPADHTVSGRPDAEVVLEPRLGGRIFERTVDGVEHDWGEVTLWEPPHRLGYLWHLRTDRSAATEVEIRFIAAPGPPPGSRSNTPDGSGSAATARSGGTGTGWAGPPCSPTSHRRRLG